MEDVGDFLLLLYRASREYASDVFQSWVFDRLQNSFAFTGAFWGAGQFIEDNEHIVPTALRSHNIDPEFLVGWSLVQRSDPVVPSLRANPGHAWQIRIPTFYAPTPDLAEFGRGYGIQSMTVVSIPRAGVRALEWISLYRDSPDALCSDIERRWLEFLSPHLGEAWRINRALNAVLLANDEPGHGVAETSTGRLLCSDQAFVDRVSRAWLGFDGQRVPECLHAAWQAPGAFVHKSRTCVVRGRNAGKLVYLQATEAGVEALTPRQAEVAQLYARGLSSKQIAQRCQLSPATVRNHLATAFVALGVHNKIELSRKLQG